MKRRFLTWNVADAVSLIELSIHLTLDKAFRCGSYLHCAILYVDNEIFWFLTSSSLSGVKCIKANA
jgi:hypothetical protein